MRIIVVYRSPVSLTSLIERGVIVGSEVYFIPTVLENQTGTCVFPGTLYIVHVNYDNSYHS